MKLLFIIGVILCGIALFGGCAIVPSDVHPIWTQSSAPPANLAPPSGFLVTPSEAYKKAKPEHFWHIYADNEYYYLLDVSSNSNSRLAYTQGVKIEGRTGLIFLRDKHHYY